MVLSVPWDTPFFSLLVKEQYEGSSIYSLVFLLWIAESRSVHSQYSSTPSPITYQKKSLSLLKDKMGHSEEVNDTSPKGPNKHYKAYTKCLLAIFPLILATHFLLGVLNTSVEKGLVCSEADGSLF